MTASSVRRLGRNINGRDLVCGDIHGYFSKLQAALDAVSFDPARDRLISVGDLVDRGPESELATEWLAKPWFHAVRGNHEQMAIDHVAGFSDPRIYRANGGEWFLALPADHQRYIAEQLDKLPFAIELETAEGLVGIVHADCPLDSWGEFVAALEGKAAEGYKQLCMWSRDRIDSQFFGGVDGLRALVVGHTPVERCTSLGNVIYVDTGAWLSTSRGGGDFTLLDAAILHPLHPTCKQIKW